VSGSAVPILMYHEVSPEPAPGFRRYTVSPEQFSRQMRWLAASGYTGIDLDGLLRARAGGPLPRRPVVITFDDGFQGCADHAVPVLRSCGFTAVFFLVTGLVGDASRWMRRVGGPELPLMSWETVRALAAEGFQFGAHTVTHPRLPDLAPAVMRTELSDARRRLQDELGRPALHLAYPFGSYDDAVRAAAAETGYVTACSTRHGLSRADDDLLALHRANVYGHDSLFDFVCRVRLGAALGERLGAALERVTRRFLPRPGAPA
jgi:peptidoglycan/xylan/chitin deacetylase (PgdA/CDA1 family)